MVHGGGVVHGIPMAVATQPVQYTGAPQQVVYAGAVPSGAVAHVANPAAPSNPTGLIPPPKNTGTVVNADYGDGLTRPIAVTRAAV